MNQNTQIERKQRYLAWFLKQFKLQVPEAEKLISYVIKSPDLLAKIHLVENIRFRPNAILISTTGADTFPFLCRLNDEYMYDIDEIIVKLSQEPPADLLLWLSMDRTMICAACQDSFFAEGTEQSQMRSLHQMLQDIAMNFTIKMQVNQAKAVELALEIDQALDRDDRESFYRLSAEYQKIQKENTT